MKKMYFLVGVSMMALLIILLNISVVTPYNKYDGARYFNGERETVDSLLKRLDLVRVSQLREGENIYIYMYISRKYPEKKNEGYVVVEISQKVLGINTTLYGIYNTPCWSSQPSKPSIEKPM